MKVFYPILGLLLLPALTPLSAQVKVEVTFDQEQFLPGEALVASVKIRNHSGQTLHMGRDANWLTFSVESSDGFVVTKVGEVPVKGEFTLESAQAATKTVDLSPYFLLTRLGHYTATATVRIKEWEGQETSPPKGFDIINGATLWSQDFGVPTTTNSTTGQPPEIRRYALIQANYLKQLRLYFRLTDNSESRVFKLYPIGPLVGMSQPEHQVDEFNHLHVLYQNGARTFSYTVINPDGEIVVRQTHEYIGSRPRLQPDKDGTISVIGGVRRVMSNDLPVPKKNVDEPTAPKP
jgi:hypothetical protein